MPDDRCEIVLYTPDHDATFASLPVERPGWSSTSGPSARPPWALAPTWPTCWCSRTVAPRSARPSPTPTARSTPTTRSRRFPPVSWPPSPVPCATPPRADLVVTEVGGWRAAVPEAADSPFGLLLAPEAHVPDLPSLDERRPGRLGRRAGRRLRPPGPLVRRTDALHGLVPPAPHRRRRLAHRPPPPPRGPAAALAGHTPLRRRRRGRWWHLLQPRPTRGRRRTAPRHDDPGPRPRAGQPDRRPHRLPRRTGPPDGDRPRHDGRGRRRAATPSSSARPTRTSPRSCRSTWTIPATVEPGWARYVAGRGGRGAAGSGLRGDGVDDAADRRRPVVERRPRGGGGAGPRVRGHVAGAGPGLPAGRAAGQSGVPSGIMDQLASAAGVEGHALLIDCRSLTVRPVTVPDGRRGGRRRLGRGPDAGGIRLRRAARPGRGGGSRSSVRCGTPRPSP